MRKELQIIFFTLVLFIYFNNLLSFYLYIYFNVMAKIQYVYKIIIMVILLLLIIIVIKKKKNVFTWKIKVCCTSTCCSLWSWIHIWNSRVRPQRPESTWLCRNPTRRNICRSSHRNTSWKQRNILTSSFIRRGSEEKPALTEWHKHTWSDPAAASYRSSWDEPTHYTAESAH